TGDKNSFSVPHETSANRSRRCGPMIIWLVEDTDLQIKKAIEAIRGELKSEKFTLLVNRDIEWDSDQPLPRLEPASKPRPPRSPRNLPDIVVLDLLKDADERAGPAKTSFLRQGPKPKEQSPGERFYERLRSEEYDS